MADQESQSSERNQLTERLGFAELQSRANHVGTLTDAESAFERVTVNLPVILNGGSLVAYTGFAFGSRVATGPLDAWAVGILAVGMLISALCVMTAYLSQHHYKRAAAAHYRELREAFLGNDWHSGSEAAQTQEWGKRGAHWRMVARVAWIFSVTAFGVGVLLMAIARL